MVMERYDSLGKQEPVNACRQKVAEIHHQKDNSNASQMLITDLDSDKNIQK